MKDRGIAEIPGGIIVLLVTAGLLALVYILGIQNYFDVKVIVKEFRIERQAIDLAQAMISNEKLVYNDGKRFYRAVFDKQKLDYVMKKGAVDAADFFSDNTQLSNVAYPNSIVVFAVRDLEETDEEENIWSAVVRGQTTSDTTIIEKFVTCMVNSIKLDINVIFRLWVFWDEQDRKKCFGELSSDFSELFATASFKTIRGFPVAIKSGDEIHVGRIVVWLVEWS